jgi:putative peptide zinc metalloprotease protein
LSPFPVKIISIDKTGTRELKVEELASNYGGGIAVRPDEEKHLIPEQGIYRVQMQVENIGLIQTSTVRGRLSLSTEPESIASRLMRLSVVAVVKESGW